MRRFFLAIIFLVGALWPADVLAALSIIDVTPNEIDSPDQVISISASASGLSEKTQYLQAVFTRDREGQTANYLGFTKNSNGEWYKYKSSPSDSDLTSFFGFMPDSGSWSGKLEAKIDVSDTGFSGPGNYLLKLAKYISSGAVYSEAKIIVVKAVKPEIPKPPEPVKEETATPKATENILVAEEPVTQENNFPEILGTESAKIATEVSLIATPTPAAPTRKILVADSRWRLGWAAAGVGAILLGGSGWLLYNRYRRQR